MRRGLTWRAGVASGVLAAVVLAGFVLLTIASASMLSQENNDAHSEQVLATLNDVEQSVLNMETGLRGYLLTGKTVFLRPYHAALAAYPAQVRELEQLTSGNPAAAGLARRIGAGVASYARNWAQPVLRLSRSDLAAARRAESSGQGNARVAIVRRQMSVLEQQQESLARTQRRSIDRVGRLALILGLAGLIVSALLITGFAIMLRRTVVQPVRRLAVAVTRMRGGDLSARVPEGGAAEVAELASGFNAMAEEVEARRHEVEQQNAELQGQQIELQGQQVELEEALTAVEQQRAKAEALHRFSEQLAAQTQLEAVAEMTLRDIADHADAQVGTLYVREETGAMSLRASRGARASDFATQLPPGQGLAGRAAAEKRLVVVGYPDTSLRLPGLIKDREIRHEAHLPLLHRDQVIGVLSLGRSRDDPFTAGDLATLTDLVQSATLACAEALTLRRAEGLAGELQAVMNSTDEGICRVDIEGRITLANRAALEQTGYPEAELLGQNSHDLLHHSRLDGTPYPAGDCPLMISARGGPGCRLSSELFWRKDGSSFPVECSGYPMLDGKRASGGVITFIDVSGRKMAERQLAAQYQTARVLAAATSVEEALPQVLEIFCTQLRWQVSLVWVPDEEDSGVLRCAAAQARPGRQEQLALLRSATVAAGRGPVGIAWQRRQPVFVAGPAETGQLSGANGSALRGELAVPITGGGGLIGVAQLAGHDQPQADGQAETVEAIASQLAQYAERTRTEAAAARMKDQFVATVSHELRTPLAAMDGWLHILLDGEPGPLTDDQRRFLGTVKRNSDRLMRLVGDLLLIGQLDAGRFSLDVADVDLAELVGETVALFASAAAEKSIEVQVDTGPAALVRGDRLRLGQLLGNLLSNAIKFTPAGGQASVLVSQHDGACRIEVTDSGVGIPPADRGHLFERFFRASTAAGITGSGLGLAICKAIAEAHDGTIRIADSGGRGTRFVVEIPLAVTAEVAL